jgi:hypothetical protein
MPGEMMGWTVYEDYIMRQIRDAVKALLSVIGLREGGDLEMNAKNPDYKPAGIPNENTTYYVLIRGPSYGSLDFEAHEAIRTGIRERLEAGGIRFLNIHGSGMKSITVFYLLGDMRKRKLLLTG